MVQKSQNIYVTLVHDTKLNLYMNVNKYGQNMSSNYLYLPVCLPVYILSLSLSLSFSHEKNDALPKKTFIFKNAIQMISSKFIFLCLTQTNHNSYKETTTTSRRRRRRESDELTTKQRRIPSLIDCKHIKRIKHGSVVG